MALTCKGMDAKTCLELGVVNEIVEREKLSTGHGNWHVIS